MKSILRIAAVSIWCAGIIYMCFIGLRQEYQHPTKIVPRDAVVLAEDQQHITISQVCQDYKHLGKWTTVVTVVKIPVTDGNHHLYLEQGLCYRTKVEVK